jgi:hypothetical protein
MANEAVRHREQKSRSKDSERGMGASFEKEFSET